MFAASHRIRHHLLPILGIGAALALSACAAYRPGSLLSEYHPTSQTVGCLDIAVDSLSDTKASGPAAKVHVGNRCNTAVVVDYRAIRATVEYADGHIGVSQVFDPELTLRPILLDARRRGWEAFEYHPVDPDDDDRVPSRLCLDISRIDRDQPSSVEVPICVTAQSGYLMDSEETQ